MKVEEKTYIKLYYGYYLSNLENIKLSNQRARSFTILGKYDKLTYKLNLSKI